MRRVDRHRVDAGREDEERNGRERIGIRPRRVRPGACRSTNPLTSNVIEPLDGEVHHRERAGREPPRRGEADRPVALDVERGRSGVVARAVLDGDVGHVAIGLLGHGADVGERRERVAAQQRLRRGRGQARGLERGGVDRHAGNGERLGGAALGEQLEVALDERRRAVELARDRRRRRPTSPPTSRTPTSREQGQVEREAAPRCERAGVAASGVGLRALRGARASPTRDRPPCPPPLGPRPKSRDGQPERCLGAALWMPRPAPRRRSLA